MRTRPRIIAGNWKMNGDPALIGALVGALARDLPGQALSSDTRVVIFPPLVFVDRVAALIGKARPSGVMMLGAQTCDWHESGAYTGEVAADMLASLGCTHVLAGHSERRTLYGETDEVVAWKFEAIQRAGMTPVLCVGETLEERQAGETEAVVLRQLEAAIDHSGSVECMKNALLAYEPVWAIGTGESASPEQAEAVHGLLRSRIAQDDEEVAAQLSILYGGSVNAANAASLFQRENIDGALVGGASLKADEFCEICRLAG